jgi:MFS superfamily sulfate permease-like transporter
VRGCVCLRVCVCSFLKQKYPDDPDVLTDTSERTTAMATVSFCVGLVITLIGVCRLGFLLDFVSTPVLTGFIMAACSITILSSAKVGVLTVRR